METHPSTISNFIRQQFPDIYNEGGENFIAFVEAYYEWLEEDGNTTSLARNFLDNRDIDKSSDEFVEYFKRMFLEALPSNTAIETKFLIKHILDLYRSKGTTRAVELLFRIVFNEDIEIYYPSTDIFTTSDSNFHITSYLEMYAPDINILLSLENKEITGTNSLAKAFVENIVTKSSNNKIIHLLYLSNVRGNFEANETISTDGVLLDAPITLGSLSDVDIVFGGFDNNIGDTFTIESDSGRQGTGRMTEIVNGTGQVNFSLNDGGWGYTTNNSISEVQISSASVTVNTPTVLPGTSNSFNNWIVEEKITQPIYQIAYINSAEITDNIEIGDQIRILGNSTTPPQIGVEGNEVRTYLQQHFVISQPITNGANGVIEISPDPLIYPRLSYTTTLGCTPIVGTFKEEELIINTSRSGTAKTWPTTITAGNEVLKNITLLSGAFQGNDIIVGNESGAFGRIVFVDPYSYFQNIELVKLSTETLIAQTTIGDIVYPRLRDISISSELISVSNNNTELGLYGNTEPFKQSSHSYLISDTSKATANLISIYSGEGASFEIASITDEDNVLVYTDKLNQKNAANVAYLDMNIDGEGSGYGVITDITIESAGNNYANGQLLIFNYGGAGNNLGQPITNPVGSINTNTSGNITGFNIGNYGAGYAYTPIITIDGPNGDGTANLIPQMSYSYGFPKNTLVEFDDYIGNALISINSQIGSIAQIYKINPGSNYVVPPFIRTITPALAEYQLKDILLYISDTTVDFLVGERIVQEIINEVAELEVGAIPAGIDFNSPPQNLTPLLNLGVKFSTAISDAVETSSDVYYTATLIGFRSPNIFIVNNILNSNFESLSGTETTALSSGTLYMRIYSRDNLAFVNVGDISNVTLTTQVNETRGQVASFSGNELIIQRTSFPTNFNKTAIRGETSGARSTILSILTDLDSLSFGDNAFIDGTVQTNLGIATKVEITSSGYGYIDDETATLITDNPDNLSIIEGSVHLSKQGIGAGFWTDTKSRLSSDKYLHDNNFYQEFSYQINSSLSLDRYAKLLARITHVAGTKLFGRVIKQSDNDVAINVSNTHVVVSRGGSSTIYTDNGPEL